MADGIEAIVVSVVSNYILSFLVLGLLVAVGAIVRAQQPSDGAMAVEKLLSWYLFFCDRCRLLH